MKVIVRHAKHKSLGTIAASASHTMRRRPTPNADPGKPAPEVWVGSTSPADDVRAVLPDKRRKNAVLALEYVLTASPEFFETTAEKNWRAYLEYQLVMLKDYYRDENVVSAVLHLDEKTPHLSVLIVPLVDGKLNARALIGTREACSIIQDMAGEVGHTFGLKRGKRGSKARHQDVQAFYADIEPARQRAAKIAADAEVRADALASQQLELRRRAEALDIEQERLSLLAASLSPVEEERAAKLHAELISQQTVAAPQEAAITSPPVASISRTRKFSPSFPGR